MIRPTLSEAVEWRTPVWEQAVNSALERASAFLAEEAKIMEVGYNTGMMSCYMASKYRWDVIGYDINVSSQKKAIKSAKYYGLENKIDFRVCHPDETLSLKGSYDAIFLKSVLYHISDISSYRKWLLWLHTIVKKGGLIIAIENGRGGMLDKFYRKIKKFRWSNFMLYDRMVEHEFNLLFEYVNVKYFGRYSQFFTPQPTLFNLVNALEEKFCPANADQCFAASIIARK